MEYLTTLRIKTYAIAYAPETMYFEKEVNELISL